ncbi:MULTISPECIES: hypothetical protein [unclassified Streptomyces]|uniref:hypothetical protein n=1 Tax=unclassified Streptomyces TaxID=2593676 RepID=UPI0011E75B0C|nr:hypothetical protein [Streptomyces sp. sk2.1]TXS66803.1 hypothetical protein EAO76_28230 [Streptomyces sp. sk2.1]
MPIWGGILLGLSIGAVLVVLVPLVLVALLLTLRAVNAAPPPDGSPLALTASELAGTWQDDRGGILVLAADGTFSTTEACGDYADFDEGTHSGFDLPSRMSGTGTWDSDDGSYRDGATGVTLDFAPGYAAEDVSGFLEARGHRGSPVLWTYVGDPDSGVLCVLEKVDRP